jgi:hypothetical protein
MSEQLALNERTREGCTIHGNHRALTPSTLLVDSASYETLAGTSFAQQKHGGIGRCHLLGLKYGGSKDVTFPDEFIISV